MDGTASHNKGDHPEDLGSPDLDSLIGVSSEYLWVTYRLSRLFVGDAGDPQLIQ